MELDYEVENRSDRELRFIWCSTRYSQSSQACRSNSPTPHRFGSDPRRSDFTPSATSASSVRCAWALSLCAAPTLAKRFACASPRGDSFLGLWQNYAGWSGANNEPYFNLASSLDR